MIWNVLIVIHLALEPGVGSVIEHTGDSENQMGRSLVWMDRRLGVAASGADMEVGSVSWFELEQGGWNVKSFLPDVDGQFHVEFGAAMAVFGQNIAIGVSAREVGGKQGAGAVDVYAKNGDLWMMVTTLGATPPAGKGEFGASVTYDAQTLVAGMPGADTCMGGKFNCGDVKAFDMNFTELPAPLQPFPVLDNSEGLGRQMVASKDVFALGATGYELPLEISQILTYRRTNNVWNVIEVIDPSLLSDECNVPAAYSSFGGALDLDGDLLLVGAPDVGRAFLLRLDAQMNTWDCEAAFSASIDDLNSGFGKAVALYRRGDSMIALVGAPDSSVVAPNAGRVYYFRSELGQEWETNDNFVQRDDDVTTRGFGTELAVSELFETMGVDFVAVGASLEFPDADVVVFPILDSLGVDCSLDEQCGSGICSDGVCCDMTCDGMCWKCDNAVAGACSFMDGGVCDPGDDGCMNGICHAEPDGSTSAGTDGASSGNEDSSGLSIGTTSAAASDDTHTPNDTNESNVTLPTGGVDPSSTSDLPGTDLNDDTDFTDMFCSFSPRGDPAGLLATLFVVLCASRRRRR